MDKKFSHLASDFFQSKNYFIPCSLAIINALLTYFFLTSQEAGGLVNYIEYKSLYRGFLFSNIFFILLLSFISVRNIYKLQRQTRPTKNGSSFRYRLVVLFSLSALLPALMMAVFSAFTFKKAADGWFEKGVEEAVYNARAVSKAYIEEHHHHIKGDVFATFSDLKRFLVVKKLPIKTLLEQMRFQIFARDLQQMIIYNKQGNVLFFVQSPYIAKKQNPKNLSAAQIDNPSKEAVTFIDNDYDHIYALLPFAIKGTQYIMRIDRKINPQALIYQQNTIKAVDTYTDLKGKKKTLERGFALIYLSFGLAIVTFMVYAGMYYASHMTSRLETLTDHVKRLEKDNLIVYMPLPESPKDEIDRLIIAFNHMADRLDKRKKELLSVNKKLDARRLLNEAVLSGVSSGVLGVDQAGMIHIMNIQAEHIFQINPPVSNLSDISQSIYKDVLEQFSSPETVQEKEYTYLTPHRQARHLHLRFCKQESVTVSSKNIDMVITVDDVTELVKAQSMNVWKDVARRIAHEIKNPLTPILLATERIKRKWPDQVKDGDVFSHSIDVIQRQVQHIKETADSFAEFAKMPKPLKKECDLVDILKNVIFLEKNRFSNISYHFDVDREYLFNGDERLLSQAFINIMKNAAEAIKKRQEHETIKGEIHIESDSMNNYVKITDNGCGLPEEIDSFTLFQPYISEKENGTGLGLAITEKIIKDHNGKINILPRQDGKGAVVEIYF